MKKNNFEKLGLQQQNSDSDNIIWGFHCRVLNNLLIDFIKHLLY